MVGNQFEILLKDFENYFQCPLQVDQNESCLIKMGIGITLQIEMNAYGLLLIGCRLGALPRNRFQDNVIKEALKANDFYPPSTGIFGLSQKSNNLILYMLVDPQYLNADKIAALLPPFITKANLWADSLAKGELPTLEEASAQPAAPPFGLKL